jgi:hypothetical protein
MESFVLPNEEKIVAAAESVLAKRVAAD